MIDYTYISIPRTGTNSVHRALKTNHKDNHKSVKVLDTSKFTFTFVRNPIERIASWYFYHRTHQPNHLIYQRSSFKEWVMSGFPHHWPEGLCKASGIQTPLSQMDFIEDDNGVVRCDFIGKVENMTEDWMRLLKELDSTPVVLEKLNASSYSNYKKYYTTKMIDQVVKRFHKEFKKFDYHV